MNAKTALLLVALSLTGCGQKPGSPPSPESTSVATIPGHETLPAGAAASGASLYELELALTDQDGRRVGLDHFAGQPVIVSMFYGSCPYACPMLISDIKRVMAALDPETRKATRVLLVSFDPERDTPAALDELAKRHELDERAWRLTRASSEDVRQLAAVLGIRYRKLENGAFNHSTVLTVLSADGVARFRQDGLGDPPEATARAVKAALERDGRPRLGLLDR